MKQVHTYWMVPSWFQMTDRHRQYLHRRVYRHPKRMHRKTQWHMEYSKHTILRAIWNSLRSSSIRWQAMIVHLLVLSRQREHQDWQSSQSRMYLQTVTTLCAQLVEQSTRTIMCLVFPVQRNTAESMYHLIRRLSISSQERCLQNVEPWFLALTAIHVTVPLVRWQSAKVAASSQSSFWSVHTMWQSRGLWQFT